jgi:hypothetical protein
LKRGVVRTYGIVFLVRTAGYLVALINDIVRVVEELFTHVMKRSSDKRQGQSIVLLISETRTLQLVSHTLEHGIVRTFGKVFLVRTAGYLVELIDDIVHVI